MTKETLETSDLRIGNLLIHDGVIVPVLEIRRDSLLIPHILENGCNIGDIAKLIEQFQPIPLVTEILDKCVFHVLGERIFIEIDNGLITLGISPPDYRDAECSFDNTEILENICYLHQLQNLYYALTGKDLEVKM